MLIISVGAVSAADGDNISAIPKAGADVDEVAIDAETDNVNSGLAIDEVNDEDINDNEMIVPASSENNASSNYAGEFDSEESLSGDSEATISPITEDNEILAAPNLASGLQNIVASLSDLSVPAIVDTLKDLGHKYDISTSDIIDVLNGIGKKYDFDTSTVVDALKDITGEYDVNMTDIASAVSDLSDKYGVDTSKIVDAFKDLSDKYGINASGIASALNDISKNYDIDASDIANSLNDLAKKYNVDPAFVAIAFKDLSEKYKFDASDIASAFADLANKYKANIPDIVDDLSELSSSYGVNVSDIVDALSGLTGNQNIEVSDIVDALSNLGEKYDINVSDLANKIIDFGDNYNLNVSDVAGVLNDLSGKYNIDVSDFAGALKDISEKYNINMSDIAGALSDLSKQYNFNVSDFTGVLSDLSEKYNFNVSDFTGALDDLSEKYGFDVSELVGSLSDLSKQYNFNVSDIIDKVAESNLNVTQIENILKDILDAFDKEEAKVLGSTIVAPTRIISVANAIGGYDYQFILKDENGAPIANKDVSVLFNGKIQTVKTNEKGWGTVTIYGNAAGTYNAVLTFLGDKKYKPTVQTATIKLIKEKTYFIAPDRAVYVQQMARGYKYSAILKDQNGNPLVNKKVLFIIDGKKTVGTTDKNGWATVTLNAVTVGAQTLTIKFAGTASCYYETSITKTIKIVREQSKLTVPDQSFAASSKSKQITATLNSKSGNPIYGAKVTLNVDGRTYVATTNNQGIATFSINLNKAGVFTATTRFADSRFFAATGTTSKITIS